MATRKTAATAAPAAKRAASKAAPPPKPAVKKAAPRRKSKENFEEDPEWEVMPPDKPGKNAVVALSGLEPAPRTTPALTPSQEAMGLRATSTPGVYLNGANVMVDGDGVMLDYSEVKSRDQARFERVIGGPVDTPAKLLKAVALDPQLPLAVRVDSAKAAAPYFDRKKPIGIDGGEDGVPIQIEVTHRLKSMSREELDQYERMLAMLRPENDEGGGDANDDA